MNPSLTDEDVTASCVSDFSDRGNRYAEYYNRLLGNGEEEGLFDGVLDLIDTIAKNKKKAGLRAADFSILAASSCTLAIATLIAGEKHSDVWEEEGLS